MKRLAVLVMLAGLPVLAACDEPAPPPAEPAPVVQEEPVAPAVEDVAAPAAAETHAPPPSTTLPADKRSSAESVQPESETLFY
ncbi:MAG TPA: hypothetical protein VLZ73_10820 [Brevundimonas sp.]|nr:hypothetical protein [Brevundimonas sp.]